MVQKVTQTIQVYGASFKVESDEPLTEENKEILIDAFEKYPANIVNTLSKGRSAEPPLKLIVAARDNWAFFSTNLVDYLISNIASIKIAGAYYPTHNTMLLQKRYLEEEVIVHELAHAIDDFAHTRFLNGGNMEVKSASDLLIDDYFFDDHPRLMNILSFLYYSGTPFNSLSLWKPEVFACAITAGILDEKKSLRLSRLESQPGGKILFDEIRQFLKNYPHIDGVDPHDQFQTNDLPLLLESGPEYRKKR